MDVDRNAEDRTADLSGPPDGDPRPTHPWPASIALVTGVFVLLVVLALASTFR